MKARIIATGEIVDLAPYTRVCEDFAKGRSWLVEELDDADDVPDYWTRLEHQYTGMAMQGILGNQTYTKHLLETSTSAKDARDIIVDASWYLAHTLVERMKKEERK